MWCPMCEYLGLSAVKAELEDICFAVLEPLCFQKVHEDRARLLTGELSSKAKVRTLLLIVPSLVGGCISLVAWGFDGWLAL